MNQFLIWNGIFALLLSLLLGLLAIYLGYSGLKLLTRNIDEEFELRNNNIAVAVVSGSFILSLGILMKSVIDPVTQTVFNLAFKFEQFGVTTSEVLTTAGIVVLQFVIALVLSLATLTIGTRLYMMLNRETNEMEEIANDNIAVALVVGAITVTLAYLLSGGMESFLAATVPTPRVENDFLPFN